MKFMIFTKNIDIGKNFQSQVVWIIALSYLFFFMLRTFLNGAIEYQIGAKMLKKRKKQQTFKEWLFYSRFKRFLPKIVVVIYYVIMITHPLGLIICIVCHFAGLGNYVGEIVTKALLLFDFSWFVLVHLFFGPIGGGINMSYRRWFIDKKHK